MTILIGFLHVTACLILILVVLLQSGKAADLAGAFGGGGSQTAFGARGAQTVMAKLTTGAAVVFMITSLALGILASRDTDSIFEDLPTDNTAGAPAPADEVPAVIPVDGSTDPQADDPGVDTPPAAGSDSGPDTSTDSGAEDDS